MKNRLCAIFGENPDELDFGYDEDHQTCTQMKLKLIYAIKSVLDDGCKSFISTIDQGAAMWGAEACIAMKELGGDVTFTSAPTGDEQASRWHPERRDRYFDILIKSDEVIEADEEFLGALLYGEDYIFENSDTVIILGNLSHPRLTQIAKRARARSMKLVCVE